MARVVAPFQWDHRERAEFVVGRLMFPQSRSRYVLGAGYGDWLRGGTAWTVDYPEADRTLARLLSRLTRMDVRAVEQPVNLDDGIDPFYWPFLISGLVGAWDLTDAQAVKLREYLLRGGFLLCDSFYGTPEWEGFVESLERVFPDRPIVDLTDDHPIFHLVYDLNDRPQIPTLQHLPSRLPQRWCAAALARDSRRRRPCDGDDQLQQRLSATAAVGRTSHVYPADAAHLAVEPRRELRRLRADTLTKGTTRLLRKQTVRETARPSIFPTRPRGMKGRDAELETLARTITAHARRASRSSVPGGSGKSMLAAALGHRLRSAFGGRVDWFRISRVGFLHPERNARATFRHGARRQVACSDCGDSCRSGPQRLIVLDNHEDDRAPSPACSTRSQARTSTFVITARRCLLAGVLIFPVVCAARHVGRRARSRGSRP